MKTANWVRFPTLFGQVETVVKAVTGEARFDKVFDRVVASCCMAGPEETLDLVTGDFSSVGHTVIYEKHGDSPCESDGWMLTTLQNDGGFMLQRIGCTLTYHFSHEEPEWLPEVRALLDRTYWRVLTTEFIVPSN